MRHALPSASVTDEIPGFPERFPVRDDGLRSWRYKAVSLICRASLRGFFGRGLQLDSMSKFPAEGPLLVVCNHLSNIDPWIFGGFGAGGAVLHVEARAVQQPGRVVDSRRLQLLPGRPRRRRSPSPADRARRAVAPWSPAHLSGRHPLGHAGNATRRSRGRLPGAPFRARRSCPSASGAPRRRFLGVTGCHGVCPSGSGWVLSFSCRSGCPGSGVTTRRSPISSGRESPNSFPPPIAGSTRPSTSRRRSPGSDSLERRSAPSAARGGLAAS